MALEGPEQRSGHDWPPRCCRPYDYQRPTSANAAWGGVLRNARRRVAGTPRIRGRPLPSRPVPRAPIQCFVRDPGEPLDPGAEGA